MAEDTVGADLFGRGRGTGVLKEPAGGVAYGGLQEIDSSGGCFEHRFDTAAQLGLAIAGVVEQCNAIGAVRFLSFKEDSLHTFPLGR